MFIECEYVNKNEIYYWKLKIVHGNQQNVSERVLKCYGTRATE